MYGNENVQENTLEKLEGANAIRLLVPLMDRRGHARDKEMENQILHCMYNLCRVNKRRQEKVRRPCLPSCRWDILTQTPTQGQRVFAFPLSPSLMFISCPLYLLCRRRWPASRRC